MFTTQQQVIEWIQSYQKFGISPGLERVQWLLNQLGNPEKTLKIIHVAGTNGKGSTCKLIANALEANGYRVGLFTSPYLVEFNNRIAINQEDIKPESLCAVADQVRLAVKEMPQHELGTVTEFELITVIALLYYSLQPIDFIVLEVGLGGRLDATNVVVPMISVITNIGYDHIHILGNRLSQIATEKAGIIKNGVPVISGVQNPEAANVIRKTGKEKKCALYELGTDFYNKIDTMSLRMLQIEFLFNNDSFLGNKHWETKLVARYQADNLSLALATLKVLVDQGSIKLDVVKTQRGIKNTTWPGRFEIMQIDPIVITDGAHNPEGFQALIESLEAQFGFYKKYIWCIGFLQDKKTEKMIQFILDKANKIIITQPKNDRSANPDQVLEEIKKQIMSRHGKCNLYSDDIVISSNIMEAIELTLQEAKEDDIVCIAGSLYLISEARTWWGKKE